MSRGDGRGRPNYEGDGECELRDREEIKLYGYPLWYPPLTAPESRDRDGMVIAIAMASA